MKEKSIVGVKLPKTERGKEKLQKLADAAEKIFAEKGFYGTSIADICERADAAVGTFYIYFDDKSAIYRYLVNDFEQRIISAVRSSIAECTSRLDRKRCGIKAFIRFAWENPLCFNIILGSLSVDKKIFEQYCTDFAKSYAESLVRDNSELKELDITTVSYVLMGITHFAALKFMIEEDFSESHLESTVDTIMQLLTDGLFLPPKN